VGLALFATVDADRVQGAAEDIVPASASNMVVLDAMIDEAMKDGSISAEEQSFIMGVARRRLTAPDVAEVEARLTSMPAAPVKTISAITSMQDATAPLDTFVGESDMSCCEDAGCGGLFDNLYIFAASDGWSGPIDDDDGNNFGYRFGFNAGVPIAECHGIGAQFGMSYGRYNLHGRDGGEEKHHVEEQLFVSAGAFKRADFCSDCPDRLILGVVYDHMITDNTGEDAWEIGELGQIRWQAGYALSPSDAIGVFGSYRLWDDEVDGDSNDEDEIWALDQTSIYWQHHWCWSADTTVYFGMADNPGEWVLGAKGEVPLSSCVSLFGNVHYVMPSTDGGADKYSEAYWNVSVGIAYYPGCNAASKTVAGRRWMPLLPVADNGVFGIDIDPVDL
jgi:hypothetical protein